MPPWIRSSAAWAGTQVPTLLTLAVLAGVALWGSTNDWKVPHSWGGSAKETKETAEATIRVVADPSQPQSRDAGAGSLGARRIEFPSLDSVQKAGIDVERVKVQSIARYVTADSLGYLSREGMHEAVKAESRGFCDACFTGEYLVQLTPPEMSKV